ncbi:UDP-N-acetylmuramate dehydrogenase [Candidatus Sneabacter namystus]|uniref:UDP-N-acetylenolpyruvoylglucosamine reductase n=1 Tax=Candidatus Sneabacter namystus TaxID=2601646 RepID=A0A5C0UHZ8_9RICK|nr:UDP-N-acetylmuramate dehydrogenase [Candidatus Sneabacter namystus]QEK39718.1 UDP-N-acetylmuramate dehydrogenase [Candidatus Sneabacter namystus]
MNKLYKELQKLNLKGVLKPSYKLSQLTRLSVGGEAEVLYKPYNTDELSYFLKKVGSYLNITILGNGSNVLIRDKGIEGVVIKLGRNFSTIQQQDNHVNVGAAVLNSTLARHCLMSEISNFSFIDCIPGSIGGSIAMNAGSYGNEFSQLVSEVHVMDKKGNTYILKNSDIQFNYRTTDIPKDWIITSAKMTYHKGKFGHINEQMEQYKKLRENSQPIYEKTAGSTFINPSNSNQKAWQYIQAIRGIDMKVGEAVWSKKHLNFLINIDNASAKDLETLIKKTQEKVYNLAGIMLQLEVKILGR